MVLDVQAFVVVAVLLALAGAAGYLGAHARLRVLNRRTYSLECDVADLGDKILTEIKRRAGGLKRKPEEALLAEIPGATGSKPREERPWYWDHVSPELKK